MPWPSARQERGGLYAALLDGSDGAMKSPQNTTGQLLADGPDEEDRAGHDDRDDAAVAGPRHRGERIRLDLDPRVRRARELGRSRRPPSPAASAPSCRSSTPRSARARASISATALSFIAPKTSVTPRIAARAGSSASALRAGGIVRGVEDHRQPPTVNCSRRPGHAASDQAGANAPPPASAKPSASSSSSSRDRHGRVVH